MSALNLSLPLRVRHLKESIAVTDAAGLSVAYVYFTADPDRRASTKRVGPAEAETIARVIAKALTAEIAAEV